MARKTQTGEITCTHCGATCRDELVAVGEASFCCNGCRAVYELLHSSELSAYYDQTLPPGIKPPAETINSRFAYLDDPLVQRQLLSFTDGHLSRINLIVPQIHCASCIWLLENLYRLHPGISRSQVNFLRRELILQFDSSVITLRQVVELLTRIGYEPHIRLEHFERVERRDPKRSLYLKIGVAGFCFANIMLLSFPDYLNSRELNQSAFPLVFRVAVLLLSLPVLFYSASGYFISAWYALRSRMVNIDVPLAIGMSALFGRSVYDIVLNAGQGFLDSFTGLVFFLLLGKLFQHRTYEQLSFDRDYKAYFPASITRKAGDSEVSVPVTTLRVGDRILVRNQELIPADSVLITGTGLIDYSFVTGESQPRQLMSGDSVYAGGRQTGTTVELEVVKEVSQSYLTSLWNSTAFAKETESSVTYVADTFGRWFTFAVLLVATATAAYWLHFDTNVAVNAVTAVLIVACPCALALSSPFVLGTALRIMGRHKLYLKNTAVVETMATTDTVVFDKTGTLTTNELDDVTFVGTVPLSLAELTMVKSLVRHSNHPVSRRIDLEYSVNALPVTAFAEEAGQGIEGQVDGHRIRLGRFSWVNDGSLVKPQSHLQGTASYLTIDGMLRGQFVLANRYRTGLEETVTEIGKSHHLAVLSGDNDRELGRLTALFGETTPLNFNQSPYDKLDAIQTMKHAGKKVLMVGDGLNDAGALRAAAVGIAVSDNAMNFTPACDGILEASQLDHLHRFVRLAQASRQLIVASIVISIFYNLVGLSFAATGHLSPLVSAILMPVSSVSVVLFATIGTNLAARRLGVR